MGSKKSIDKVTEKISNTINKGKTWRQEELINALNPIIIGWSNYHQPAVSSGIFKMLDSRIWNMLWHWAKRRHTNNPNIGLPENTGTLMRKGTGYSVREIND